MRAVAHALAAAGVALGLAACAGGSRAPAGAAETACAAPARPMVRLELLFGRSLPDGRTTSDAEWIDFLETEVTPRFPSGLTVLSGLGQWQGSDGRVTREQSNLLIIWHEPSKRVEADIEEIRAAYERRFQQESVMRVEGLSCVSF